MYSFLSFLAPKSSIIIAILSLSPLNLIAVVHESDRASVPSDSRDPSYQVGDWIQNRNQREAGLALELKKLKKMLVASEADTETILKRMELIEERLSLQEK